MQAPRSGSARALTEICDGDLRIAAVIHDAALSDEPAFIDGARAYAVMTLDNQRLGEEAAARTVVGRAACRAADRSPSTRPQSASGAG